MKKLLIVGACAILLNGCTHYVTHPSPGSQTLKIKRGMTEEQVINILGNPYRKDIEETGERLDYGDRYKVCLNKQGAVDSAGTFCNLPSK